MSAKHSFPQDEICCHPAMFGPLANQAAWNNFITTANSFGYKVVVTGGNVLTHQINCSKEDYEVIRDLAKGK